VWLYNTTLNYEIWTDGSSIEQKYGGWSLVIQFGPDHLTKSGSVMNATNNIAELTAIKEALKLDFFQTGDNITIYSDSLYAVNLLNKGYRAKANSELVLELRKLVENSSCNINFVHVKGHGKDTNNKFADGLAYSEAKALKESMNDPSDSTTLTLNEYQDLAHTTSLNTVVRDEQGIIYPTLGLISEVGEFCGKLKKLFRDKGGQISAEDLDALSFEMGDILWYTQEILTKLESKMGDVAQKNLIKLLSRKDRGVIKGSGDNR
jgi:ribonuclease HI/NTP pyrophosphatase (non-canonical NTP hydrolase)